MTMAGDSLPNVVFVLGAPGAGKGTQCEKIVQEFGYVHLSAGDLLRAERKTGGPLAQEIDGHIRNGTIVPVQITCDLLHKAMQRHMVEEKKFNFLIDGFPRNQDNLQGWQREMSDKANVKFVLFFKVEPDTGIERAIKRGQQGSGRTDDNLESLKLRIITYTNDTMPIVDHYDKQNLVRVVDGSPSVDKVFEEVKKLFS